MSDEKKEKAEESVAKTAKKPKARRKNPIAKWFRELRSELKKVVWPTPKQIINNTSVALAIMLVSAVAVWALDFVGTQIFQMIRTLATGIKG
jgi:preprotein translocase subunit SecE